MTSPETDGDAVERPRVGFEADHNYQTFVARQSVQEGQK